MKIETLVVNGIPYIPQPMADEWPKWYLSKNGRYLVRHDSAEGGVFWCGNVAAETLPAHHTEKWHIESGYRRIFTTEAESLLAKWAAERASAESFRAGERGPRVYRNEESKWVRVYGIGSASPLFDNQGVRNGDTIENEEWARARSSLLTGPEAAEYVAAARENRDAVWPPKESDPWPHWWLSDEGMFLVRHDNALAGWCWDLSGPNKDSFELDPEDTEKHHDKSGYRRIPAPEAAALLAKWEADRNSSAGLTGSTPQPELEAAESVAERVDISGLEIHRACCLGCLQEYVKERIASAILQDRKARGV